MWRLHYFHLGQAHVSRAAGARFLLHEQNAATMSNAAFVVKEEVVHHSGPESQLRLPVIIVVRASLVNMCDSERFGFLCPLLKNTAVYSAGL